MITDISIVIPVYNRAHTLRQTLASLDAQQVQADAVILVDNNSTDGSADIIAEWVSKHAHALSVKELKPGATAARNRGLREVTTRYVMFFDSDDVMEPRHVADFAQGLRDNPGCDILGRDIEMHLHGCKVKTGRFVARNAMFYHLVLGSLSTQRYVVLTDLVRRVGGWNESIAGWNDFELGVRLLLQRPKVVKLSGPPTVKTFVQADSITRSRFSETPERWESSLKQCRQSCIDGGRHDLLKWLDMRAMVLAAHYMREGDVANAQRLYQATLQATPYKVRMRLLYYHNRLFKRFTWLAARMLFLK